MGGGGVGEGDGDAVATVVGDSGGAAALAMGGVVRLRGAGVAMAVMDGGDGSAAAVVSDVGDAVAMRRRLWRMDDRGRGVPLGYPIPIAHV